MAVGRIVAYATGHDRAASRDFYVEILGMQVAMEDPVLDLQSPEPRGRGHYRRAGDAGSAAKLRRRRG